MVDILGVDVDFLSLIPAIFGALLSLYNWLQMHKPANIYPGRLVNYGFISSSYDKAMFFCLPLTFENEGANKGLITEIKIGFKNEAEIKYIDVDAKVRLNELTGSMAPRMDYEKFTDEGYVILLPTYPIGIEGGESQDITIVSTVSVEDDIIPIGKDSEIVIEVYFGKNKLNTRSFPFYLSQESADSDNTLIWLKTQDK
ncbi:MAG: hypothetical protein ACTSVU_02245 [Promethearchaeota archaeon]